LIRRLKFKPIFNRIPPKNKYKPRIREDSKSFLETARKYPITVMNTGAAGGPPRNNEKAPVSELNKLSSANNCIIWTWIIKITANPLSKSAEPFLLVKS